MLLLLLHNRFAGKKPSATKDSHEVAEREGGDGERLQRLARSKY